MLATQQLHGKTAKTAAGRVGCWGNRVLCGRQAGVPGSVQPADWLNYPVHFELPLCSGSLAPPAGQGKNYSRGRFDKTRYTVHLLLTQHTATATVTLRGGARKHDTLEVWAGRKRQHTAATQPAC